MSACWLSAATSDCAAPLLVASMLGHPQPPRLGAQRLPARDRKTCYSPAASLGGRRSKDLRRADTRSIRSPDGLSANLKRGFGEEEGAHGCRPAALICFSGGCGSEAAAPGLKRPSGREYPPTARLRTRWRSNDAPRCRREPAAIAVVAARCRICASEAPRAGGPRSPQTGAVAGTFLSRLLDAEVPVDEDRPVRVWTTGPRIRFAALGCLAGCVAMLCGASAAAASSHVSALGRRGSPRQRLVIVNDDFGAYQLASETGRSIRALCML
jgi:hypothetical protein